MASQIKSVEEPEDKEKGLYLVTFLDENCNEYTAHMTKTAYGLSKVKEEIRKNGYDMALIEQFEDLIKEELRESDSYNC